MSRLLQNKPGRVDWLLWLLTVAALGVFTLLVMTVWQQLSGETEREVALAQPPGGFESGSDGSDGALNLTAPGTVLFDPRTFNPPLDPDGDCVFHFTTITIAAGVTVVLRSPYLNCPVYWLASGAVQIDGVIDLNGETNFPVNAPADRRPSIPGAGGFPGGVGKWGSNFAQPGNGPGAGGAAEYSGGAGGAGHTTIGGNNFEGIHGLPYGNMYLEPLLGGSGGGGSSDLTPANYNGGAGGGALLIASSVSLAVNGVIQANAGYTGNNGTAGGSGGAIHLLAPVISGTGSVTATGCPGCSAGRGGANGRIRLDAFQQNFTGTANPTAVKGSPFSVYPSPPPRVRVVDMAGLPVSEVPTGSFQTPDVTIDSSSTVTITVEAQNIPVGNRVQLFVYSENGLDQMVHSTPLVGTFDLSTATIYTTLPSGYSYMYVRSEWRGFFQYQQRYTTGDEPTAVTVADLNNDGILDLATANYSSDNVSVLLGNGNGTFQLFGTHPVGNGPFSITAADIDENNTLDLIVGNTYYDSTISILKGSGDGHFQPQVKIGTYSSVTDVQAAYLNDDIYIDLITSGGPKISVFLGENGDTFSSRQDFGNYSFGRFAIGDLNEDSELDLAVTSGQWNNANISLLFGDGSGNFPTQEVLSMGQSNSDIAIADFDRNGVLDIASANNQGYNVSVRLGQGNGAFYDVQNSAAGRENGSMAVGDINGDGRLDLTLVDNYNDKVLVLLGLGNGTFQSSLHYFAGQNPYVVESADLNGDDLLDLVVTNGISDDVSVLLHR